MKPAAPLLRDVTDIARFLEAHADLHALLLHVESLDLPDCWIGAGLIRNAVWDFLHGRAVGASACNDVDVIYFDPAHASESRDAVIERQLKALSPHIPWQIRNQARMHQRNGDAPYRNTFDAIACWPETATAIAARTIRGQIEVIAPHGVEDLINLIVRPTPAFSHKMDIYRERLSSKDWARHWPQLRFLTSESTAKAAS